jgi:hypothetical protein
MASKGFHPRPGSLDGGVYRRKGRIYAVSEDVSVERLPVAQAAEVLGVTRDAIHKRIHRGTIAYEKGDDGRFYVYVDTSTEGLDSSTDTSNLQHVGRARFLPQ